MEYLFGLVAGVVLIVGWRRRRANVGKGAIPRAAPLHGPDNG